MTRPASLPAHGALLPPLPRRSLCPFLSLTPGASGSPVSRKEAGGPGGGRLTLRHPGCGALQGLGWGADPDSVRAPVSISVPPIPGIQSLGLALAKSLA